MNNIETINNKKHKLAEICEQLKKDFIGIDYIIDELIGNVEVWYLSPELLSAPPIINLWGMTGTGKTDLIRKFVNYLDMNGSYVELGVQDATNYNLPNKIRSNGLKTGEPGIILIDEMQKFRVKEKDDSTNHATNNAFAFWQLLSDGQITRNINPFHIYRDLHYFNRIIDYTRKQEGKKNTPIQEFSDDYNYKSICDDLLLDYSILLKFKNFSDFEDYILGELGKPRIVDYSKCLIFITGNLDSAYHVEGFNDNCDIDADLFYSLTKDININNIKAALSKIFNPEQVARFGNVHLIYRSLNKQNYKDFITLKLETVKKKVYDFAKINISFTQEFHDLIYRNAVFPTQGVRPVASTINSIFSSHISKLVYDAMNLRMKTLVLDYKDESIKAHKLKPLPFVGEIDKIRAGLDINTVALVAVHESGHCVAYVDAYNTPPLQITARSSSSMNNGFIYNHNINANKENIFSKLVIQLAGFAAEELIFGEGNVSTGSRKDREMATSLACAYIRQYGFADLSAFYHKQVTDMETEFTDSAVESLLKDALSKARKVVKESKQLILELANRLTYSSEILRQSDIVELYKNNGLTIGFKAKDEVVGYEYSKHLILELSAAN